MLDSIPLRHNISANKATCRKFGVFSSKTAFTSIVSLAHAASIPYKL